MNSAPATESTWGSPSIDLLEGIATARTIRRYHFDPVPEEDLNKILWSATRAPSGTNRQPFRFLVLRDSEQARRVKAMLGEAFRGGWHDKSSAEGWTEGDFSKESRRGRTLSAMQFFVDNFEKIPVIIFPCLVRYRPPMQNEGASIFPACQNLHLAARALGYGVCFSGWHQSIKKELEDVLGLPENVELMLTITLGKPRGKHGPLRRMPVSNLIFEDHWDNSAPFMSDPPGTRFSRGGPPKKG